MADKDKVVWSNKSEFSLSWMLMSKDGVKQGPVNPGGFHFAELPTGGGGVGWVTKSFSGTVTSLIPPPENYAALLIAFKAVNSQEDFEELQRVIQEIESSL